MKSPTRHLLRLELLLTCLLLATASTARAADLYVTGILGLGAGTGETGGFVDFGGATVFSNAGDDLDSSPVYGAALGFELGLGEIFPLAWDMELPKYAVRLELEGTFGRDFELVTSSGTDPFLSRVSSWSTLLNYWMDFPVHAGISPLFGRVPIIEPLTFGLGAGMGLGSTSVDSTNNAAFGKSDEFQFVWQAGGGFGYELTDRVTLGLDYRYVSLGSQDFPLAATGGLNIGTFSVDLASHELALGVRVRFFTVPSPNMWNWGWGFGGDR